MISTAVADIKKTVLIKYCRSQGIYILVNILLGALKWPIRDFPGGAVVKNLPANAGDTGSSPGPGRSHMPRSNKARATQLLKPAHLEPVFRNKRSHCNEKPSNRNEE